MARNNDNKMLQAVLLDENLMKFGRYTPSDISTIEQALDSDNCVINAVAQIIKRTGEKVPFDSFKIINAINKAFLDVDGELYENDTAQDIAAEIKKKIENCSQEVGVE